MTDHRDPKTGERTAVLRPEDSALSLRRLAEWNALMDAVLTAVDPKTAGEAAGALWLTTLREQGWRFVGWLADDGKGTSGGTQARPGDLHMPEKQFEKDFRP